jgi:hypothetical protein
MIFCTLGLDAININSEIVNYHKYHSLLSIIHFLSYTFIFFDVLLKIPSGFLTYLLQKVYAKPNDFLYIRP